MADEPTSQADGQAPSSESGSFDSGAWFEQAGIDPQATDPSAIATARDFYDQYGSSGKVYTEQDYKQAVESRVQEYFQDPTTHNVLKEHFRQALEAEARMQQAQNQQAQEMSPDLAARQLQQLQQTTHERFGSLEKALGELVKLEQARQKRAETEDWHSGFSSKLKDVVSRGTNGTLNRDALERELRRRYASGELTDDSPAALQKALKTLVSEKLAERQAWANELGLDLTRVEGKPLPPNMPIDEAVDDDDTFDALLSKVINHGMPPDAMG